MNRPGFLQTHPDGATLAIKLQPRASRTEIGELKGDELKIRVTAPPVDAAANEALFNLLADQLDCPRGAVRILRGRTSRHKTVLIVGLTVEKVMGKLKS